MLFDPPFLVEQSEQSDMRWSYHYYNHYLLPVVTVESHRSLIACDRAVFILLFPHPEVVSAWPAACLLTD